MTKKSKPLTEDQNINSISSATSNSSIGANSNNTDSTIINNSDNANAFQQTNAQSNINENNQVQSDNTNINMGIQNLNNAQTTNSPTNLDNPSNGMPYQNNMNNMNNISNTNNMHSMNNTNNMNNLNNMNNIPNVKNPFDTNAVVLIISIILILLITFGLIFYVVTRDDFKKAFNNNNLTNKTEKISFDDQNNFTDDEMIYIDDPLDDNDRYSQDQYPDFEDDYPSDSTNNFRDISNSKGFTYNEPESGITLQLPQGYKENVDSENYVNKGSLFTVDNGEILILGSMSPLEEMVQDFSTELPEGLTILDIFPDIETTESYHSNFVENYFNQFGDLLVVNTLGYDEISMNGVPGYWFSYLAAFDSPEGNRYDIGLSYFFVYDDKAYFIFAYAPFYEFDKMSPAVSIFSAEPKFKEIDQAIKNITFTK